MMEVSQAMRLFCAHESNPHALTVIRAVFARQEREGNLAYFVENCAAMCGSHVWGMARAYAVQTLAEMPLLAWPIIAMGARYVLNPTMGESDTVSLVRALAKTSPFCAVYKEF